MRKNSLKTLDEHFKMTGRTDFGFYHAVFDLSNGKIWIEKEI